MEKQQNECKQHFSSFLTSFSTISKTNFSISATFELALSPYSPYRLLVGVQDLRTGNGWFNPMHNQYSFQGLMTLQQDSFLSHRCPLFLLWLHGKAASAWKEYCSEYWLKDFQDSMDRCTGHCYITEILLKTALNTIQSVNFKVTGNLRIL